MIDLKQGFAARNSGNERKSTHDLDRPPLHPPLPKLLPNSFVRRQNLRSTPRLNNRSKTRNTKLMNNEETAWMIAFAIVLWIYPGICLQRIAKKTKTEPHWLAWIPIANLYLICKLAKQPGWWFLLCLIPFIGVIFTCLLLCRVPQALGINDGRRFLMIIPTVNLFFLGYLAFRAEPGNAASPETDSGAI